MRVGIHSGPVVVGTLGNDLRVEFKAVGDTVNLASRMEHLAEPGATYVTEDLFKITEGFFRFEALGVKEIKGKEEPVKVYRVITTSSRRTRFDVNAERGLTPLVGRERELEILLDGFEMAKSGRGQAYSIIAEAGAGKSRLLYEFRKAVSNEEVTFLEGKCLSYSRGTAYHPIIDLYKSNFDILENEPDYQIKDKVESGLKQMGVDEAANLPYLLELLSVEDSGIDRVPMRPEGRKERTIEMIIRTPLKGSEIQPLVMAIEDLHWIDKNSEEVLKQLLDSISGARILLIFTYRPEFVHIWGGRSYHNQVNLNRLSNRETLTMVSHLLDAENIEADLEKLILEKTEGVPFFIEEFVKSLIDLNILERRNGDYCLIQDIQTVTIPSTIQDVIMARVDSLPEAVKGVLQTGSVIEREFSYQLIKQVTGIAQEDLLSHLSVLKDSELVYERGIYPQSTYIFKHALTREVVYESILATRKKTLHAKIGDAIEESYKNNLDEHYETLAEHYVTGESYEKGAAYCRLAAVKNEEASSFDDAIAYAEKRVTCLERLPRSEDVERNLIDARTALGLYYSQIGFWIDAKEAVEPVVELALQLDYKRRISQLFTIMGIYRFFVEKDFPGSMKHLEDALKIAEELNDTLSLVMASFRLGEVLGFCCGFERALFHMEKALEINVKANSLFGIAMAKSFMALYVHNPQGKLDLAYQTSGEAMQTAEESGDSWSKQWAYYAHGVSCHFKGLLEEAEEHSLRVTVKEVGERNNLAPWGYHLAGNICVDKGEYRKSQDYYAKAISISEDSYIDRRKDFLATSLLNRYKIALARVKAMIPEKIIDLNEVFKCFQESKLKLYEGEMTRFVGEILLDIDDSHMDEAENWIRKAIDINEQYGTRWDLGRDYAAYAEYFRRKGDGAKARENMSQAIDIMKECNAEGWVERYELARDRLEA